MSQHDLSGSVNIVTWQLFILHLVELYMIINQSK